MIESNTKFLFSKFKQNKKIVINNQRIKKLCDSNSLFYEIIYYVQIEICLTNKK